MISPISFTEKALQKLLNIREEQDIPGTLNLRVGAEGGGCAGVNFILGFDEPKEDDQFFTVDEMVILVDKKQAMHILGLEIDWVEHKDEEGFSFNQT